MTHALERLVTALLCAGFLVSSVGAQEPERSSAGMMTDLMSTAPAPGVATFEAVARIQRWSPEDSSPQQACLECDVPRRFWRAFGELMIVQLIPWSVNYFVRDLEFARVGPESWWRNMMNPWVWDDNHFLNNQFSHPPVEANLDNEVTERTPGEGTISVDFFGAKGRVDFSVVRKP